MTARASEIADCKKPAACYFPFSVISPVLQALIAIASLPSLYLRLPSIPRPPLQLLQYPLRRCRPHPLRPPSLRPRGRHRRRPRRVPSPRPEGRPPQSPLL